jgi:hypothetical protein
MQVGEIANLKSINLINEIDIVTLNKTMVEKFSKSTDTQVLWSPLIVITLYVIIQLLLISINFL